MESWKQHRRGGRRRAVHFLSFPALFFSLSSTLSLARSFPLFFPHSRRSRVISANEPRVVTKVHRVPAVCCALREPSRDESASCFLHNKPHFTSEWQLAAIFSTVIRVWDYGMCEEARPPSFLTPSIATAQWARFVWRHVVRAEARLLVDADDTRQYSLRSLGARVLRVKLVQRAITPDLQ